MTIVTFSAGTGDCWGRRNPDPPNDSSFTPSGTFLYLGHDTAIGYFVKDWIPFVVNLPRGLQIKSARIKWIATTSRSENVSVYIGCEAADNPSAPTNMADLEGRAWTASYLTTALAAYTIGVQYSYDITGAVQEILNRAGFAVGNTIAVLVENAGSVNDNRRLVASAENGTYGGAILEIDFEEFIPQGIIL